MVQVVPTPYTNNNKRQYTFFFSIEVDDMNGHQIVKTINDYVDRNLATEMIYCSEADRELNITLLKSEVTNEKPNPYLNR